MRQLIILSIVALTGITTAGLVVWKDSKSIAGASIGLPTLTPPFVNYIAGSGLVEAATRNIPVGTHLSGIIAKVFVKPGDHVSIGDPLFKINDREITGQLMVASANVNAAKAAYQRSKHHLDTATRLRKTDSGAVSEEAYVDKQDDVMEKKAALSLAEAKVEHLEIDRKRYTVHAQLPGIILKVDMQPGQYVEASATAPPLMMIGGGADRHLRVDVDEQDAWRFQPGARAVAYLRGHPELKVTLHYDYTEPYVVPKTMLTGLSTERTDSRVLQVVYSIEPPDFPLYIGQQLDVFIQASKPAVSSIRKGSP